MKFHEHAAFAVEQRSKQRPTSRNPRFRCGDAAAPLSAPRHPPPTGPKPGRSRAAEASTCPPAPCSAIIRLAHCRPCPAAQIVGPAPGPPNRDPPQSRSRSKREPRHALSTSSQPNQEKARHRISRPYANPQRPQDHQPQAPHRSHGQHRRPLLISAGSARPRAGDPHQVLHARPRLVPAAFLMRPPASRPALAHRVIRYHAGVSTQLRSASENNR